MKRIASIFVCVLLVAAMGLATACGGGTSGGTTGGTTGSTTGGTTGGTTDGATDSAAATGGASNDHVVINYMVTGNIPTNKTMTDTLPIVNQYLTEKLNAELSVTWIEWTDYMSKYNLELASQNGNIDLVGTATDWLDAWPNCQNGAFLELTPEMIQTNAPLTWAQVPADHWELCKYDGKIYLIPEDHFAQWTNHGFMYRGDWANEAGLTGGINSWDEMGQYFQYIKENKPNVIPWDGKPDASVVAQLSGGWLASHTPSIYVEGLRVDLFFGESKDNPYKLTNYFLEGDELVNFAINQKNWADAGYWKEDVLNNTSIDTAVEMREGITGTNQHHSMTYYGGDAKRLEEYQPGADMGFFWFGKEQGNLVSLNITHGAMAIGAKSKNPERALQVYDLLRNDQELYRLFNYGVEGKQYILSEDGRTYTRPDGFNEDTDSSGFNYWWGRNDDLELVGPLTNIEKRDALWAEYDKVAVVYPYGKVVFALDSISSELDNLSNIYNTYMPRITFGKVDDPAAFVAEFRQQLKSAGYEKCITEIEKQLAAVYGG